MEPEGRKQTGERRKYVRYACETEIKAVVDFNPDVARRTFGKLPPIVFRRGQRGTVRDISEKGLSIEVDDLLPDGMILKIAVENPVTVPVESAARVVWSKKIADAGQRYAIGMVFRNMKDRHKRNLDKLLQFLRNIPE